MYRVRYWRTNSTPNFWGGSTIHLTAADFLEAFNNSDTWNILGDFDTLDEANARLDHYENRVRTRDYVMDIISLDDPPPAHVYRRLPATEIEVHSRHETRWLLSVPAIPLTTPTRTPLSGKVRNMIKVGIRRVNGSLKLLVNASEFHQQLDEIGCTHDGSRYNDRPSAAQAVADGRFNMSPEVLLKRDYKEVEVLELKDGQKVTTKVPVTACVDLAGVWSTPPSFDQLKKLCNSAEAAARKILEHYQPIDISVEIHKRIVKA